jgi:glutathione S-transferase
MIVYGSSLSPFVRKTMAFAAEKGLDVELRPNAGPAGPDPEFLAASPFRKIPAMRDGDFALSDSSAIVAYMEKLKPSPELIPSEARDHARTIWFDEWADTIYCAAGIPMFFNRIVAPMLGRPADLAAADRAEKELLPPALDYLEGVAPAPGGFLVGGRLTLADIAVASPFVNLRHLGLDYAASHPKAAAYVDAVLARPAFARLIEGETAFLAQRAA